LDARIFPFGILKPTNAIDIRAWAHKIMSEDNVQKDDYIWYVVSIIILKLADDVNIDYRIVKDSMVK